MSHHDCNTRPSENLFELLEGARRCFENIGDEFSSFPPRFADLEERLREERFHLAVLGQFKRGKSTFLNALLGENLLPSSVIPLTAIPTFLRTGETPEIVVHWLDGRPPESVTLSSEKTLRSVLDELVTERGNPENALGISFVEIAHPSPILRRGVLLVDTPGIGSTFLHNTEATRNFLSQCDAALFVVSADPPVTEVEMEFLKSVQEKIPHIFFVLNKMDQLDEPDLETALGFFRNELVLRAGVAEDAPVFPVSARLALEASLSGNDSLRARSGIEAVEEHLFEFLAKRKTEALTVALARKARDIAQSGAVEIQLRMRALEIPLEDLEEKAELFKRKVEEVRRERESAGDLLAGDRKRILQELERHAKRVGESAKATLLESARAEGFEIGAESLDEDKLRALFDKLVPVFFERYAGETKERFRTLAAEMMGAHAEREARLLDSLWKKAADLFHLPDRPSGEREELRIVREPYWVSRQWSSKFLPVPTGFLEKMLPEKIRRAHRRRRIEERLDSLILSNVENLRWSVFQSVNDSFRAFSSALEVRLSDALKATVGGMDSAISLRKERSAEVLSALEPLRRALEELRPRTAALSSLGDSPARGRTSSGEIVDSER